MSKVGKYELSSVDKYNRAIFGSNSRAGKPIGGVGENATEAEILAEYDRLGGLILEGNNKVETGSFFDFKNNKPREVPVITYIYRTLDGEAVSIPEGSNESTLGLRADVGVIIKKKKRKTSKDDAN